MKLFTGYEYVMIDIANQFGLDKELFETRINWVKQNHANLESLMDKADSPILYIKAVRALRDAEAGVPTGFMMGMDACASGPQIMSVLTGCYEGASHTGLVDPQTRSDLYRDTTTAMDAVLASQGFLSTTGGIDRSAVKEAVMPFFYGSQAKPKEIFGEGTPEYLAFFEALQQITPGAFTLMHELIACWQPFAKHHQWTLPDGFVAKVKVMEAQDKKIEIQELGGATFTHRFYENQGSESGLSLAA